LSNILKTYQVRYTEYGVVKWCYTNNLTDCYLSIQDLKENKNRLLFKKDFYEKLWTYQQTNLQNGQS
jgi:hypothetical protein